MREQSDWSLGRLKGSQKEWTRLTRRVATIIIKMPLWKLQTVGRQNKEFLYRKSEYRDRTIRVLPGVPEAFQAFHPLLTSMTRGGWMEQIHRIGSNREILGPGAELESFLFSSDRKSLAKYREMLRQHQAGECFYCGKKVADEGDLDHFIPWSRYPLDLGHNFVFAHKGCNNSKRDHLAAVTHLERWREQNLDGGGSFSQVFDDAGLANDLDRSHLIARWAYEQGFASGTRLWVRDGEFEDCDYRWQTALRIPTVLRLAADKAPYGYDS